MQPVAHDIQNEEFPQTYPPPRKRYESRARGRGRGLPGGGDGRCTWTVSLRIG